MTQHSTVRQRSDWPVWLLAPTLIFLFGRATSTALLAWIGADAVPHPGGIVPQIPAPITVANLLQSWDAQWYLKIVTEGYPTEMPLIDGDVTQNQWAFYPLYPLLVKALTLLGVPFLGASLLVSLSCGCAAVVLLFRMMAPTTGTFTAILTVTAFSFSMPSLVLGMPYGESLAVLLLILALWALARDRPGSFVILSLALAFTRPITPALAAVAGVLWIMKWRRRKRVPFPIALRFKWATASFASAAFFVLWPLTPGIVTGKWNAYALTQQAWNSSDGDWNSWILSLVRLEPAAPYVLVLLVLMFFIARQAKTWPMPVRLWTVLYPLFILGASRVTPSIFRYLLLTVAPAWPLPSYSNRATPGMQIALVSAVVTLGICTQILWISGAWLGPGNIFP